MVVERRRTASASRISPDLASTVLPRCCPATTGQDGDARRNPQPPAPRFIAAVPRASGGATRRATGPVRLAPMNIGYLGLGSNVGDRRANLQAAVDALPGHGVEVLASSSTYDTDPVGEILDQPDFLNACLRVRTSLDPEALLDAAKAIERALGREPGGPKDGPRPIDVDVLLLGYREYASERLALPHAQVLVRRFVLIPLLELDFELATPSGERLADALAALAVGEDVRHAGPPLQIS
jgi:2-amino-4-hydroxy-6-hydroxymethyldihydropteridine diphosphokinase